MYIYKRPKLERAEGGYIVSYEKYMQAKDSYDGMSYVSEGKEIFDEDKGEEALKRLDEIFEEAESMEAEAHVMKMDAEKARASQH